MIDETFDPYYEGDGTNAAAYAEHLEKENQPVGYWFCPNCKEAAIPERVTFEELHDTCGHRVQWIESVAPILLTVETARKIWDAGLRYQLKESTETDDPLIPDFDTFYKQLINQQ